MLVLMSIEQNLIPKLVLIDVDKMHQLIKIVFPNINISIKNEDLYKLLSDLCIKYDYIDDISFVNKILEFYNLSKNLTGVMLVGPTGSGKSAAFKVLKNALNH